jgi:hypothetical protein
MKKSFLSVLRLVGTVVLWEVLWGWGVVRLCDSRENILSNIGVRLVLGKRTFRLSKIYDVSDLLCYENCVQSVIEESGISSFKIFLKQGGAVW